MLKKTIKYVDYNGIDQADECYFNLSKAELTEMEFSKTGGFENYITNVPERLLIEDMIAEMAEKNIALF